MTFRGKRKEEKSAWLCGCRLGDLWSWGFFFDNHEVFILTRGKKRRKKILCISTGKYWYIPMPDLQEVKNGN